MGYTKEEKDLLKAARMLRDNCSRYEDCEGCIFDKEVCTMYDLPDDWNIISEEEEEQ